MDHGAQQHERPDCEQEHEHGRYHGRRISLAEVKSIFDRVWSASCRQGQEQDHGNQKDRIRIAELYMIIDLVGTFLNKAEPDESCTHPDQQWAKYAQVDHVDGEAQQYVHRDDMPSLLFNVFASHKDVMRMSFYQRILTHGDTDNQQIIGQILEDVWAEYDYDGDGMLDTTTELYDFVKSVLQENQNMIAQRLGAPTKEVTDAEIKSAVQECKTINPGRATKQELSEWMVSYAK